ncbi:MAG: response regulator [Spirochaetia bacterium]|nr:response regulator [Spirochaetia bacterium]
MGTGTILVMLILGMCVMASVLFYVYNKRKMFVFARLATCIAISNVMMPVAYFFMGGLNSGIAAYFTLALVLIFLLLKGKIRIWMGISNVFIVTGIMLLDYFGIIVPQDVFKGNRLFMVIDHVQCFAVCGVCIGFIVHYQNYLLNKENERVKVISSDLEIAKDEALRQAAAKTMFLSNMSHEMRTPMNAIIGMSLIGKSAPDLPRKDYALERINNASSYLLAIINDILDMAKIDAEKTELAPVNFTLEKAMRKIDDLIRPRMEEKKQNFSISLDPAICGVLYADEQRLAQVIMNLLSNAVKFTPEGGNVGLDVRLIEKNNGAYLIRFTVTDTGIGISQEQRLNLFKPFVQAEKGANRVYGGIGLGLSISRRLVELMGGKIEVESEPGKGSAFSFSLCIPYDSPETSDGEAPEVQETIEGIFKDRRILLAEDIDINREIVLALLEPTGIVIDCAENGEEAVCMFSRQRGIYDAVLMDIQMPVMDGVEASRGIRALPLPEAARVPIIAMTANVFKDDIEKYLSAGMNGHIGKPIDTGELIAKLKEFL